MLCVKTKFWDKGVGDVMAYIRRRTVDGDWLWLESKAVSYVTQPVPGIILHETKVQDEQMAHELNRVTKITAIVVQAVEAAKLSSSNEEDAASEEEEEEEAKDEERSKYPRTQDLLEQISGLTKGVNGDNFLPAASKLEQEMMERVAAQLEPPGSNNTSGDRDNKFDRKKESFDPFSMMESVRQGVRLDLGLTQLRKPEVKMIALVLTGKVSVDEVCPIVLTAVRNGQSIESALALFAPNCVNQNPQQSSNKKNSKLNPQQPISVPPRISVINLSYTYIGNRGIDILSELIYGDNTGLKTIDISFCGIDEKGFVAFAKALQKRKRKGIAPLIGLILSGNIITNRAATEMGMALAPVAFSKKHSRRRRTYSGTPSAHGRGGNESDDEEEDSDFDSDDDFDSPSPSRTRKKESRRKPVTSNNNNKSKDGASSHQGLQLLHLSSTSLTPQSMNLLLDRLGPTSTVRELNLSSNKLGAPGAEALVDFLQGVKASGSSKRPGSSTNQIVMPSLDRLDLSNNNLGDDGTNKLTRAVAKRTKSNFVELRLSSNEITAVGIETMMNKLLQHNLVSLSLDKNAIGDQGCQLVAASLQSMKSLCRLNLGFNQIGSRGIGSLMRSVVACESITYLELSGNVLKISGAVALAFTLANHPRLEELDLDDCCLGQAAQCHIVAGIISNRWVPMKRLNGFAVGPPMVEIGALDDYAQGFSNDECFRIRKDEQMKTILQWMESNRAAKLNGESAPNIAGMPDTNNFLTPDFVSSINEVHGTPSQNAYLRLLGWLSRIPFDEDELSSLQKYFYDIDGGDGERGSDGYINLKLRGDLLAALDSDVATEIRDEIPVFEGCIKGSVGLDLASLGTMRTSTWNTLQGDFSEKMPKLRGADDESDMDEKDAAQNKKQEEENAKKPAHTEAIRMESAAGGAYRDSSFDHKMDYAGNASSNSAVGSGLSLSSAVSNHMQNSGSDRTVGSSSSRSRRDRRGGGKKARITMFPMFKQKLEDLKATAAEMIESEEDPEQQEIILTQYAEASLTILRQLRYHCMNSGLDGWRQGGLKRKVLIVDDSNVTRKLVSRAFEKANFIVDTAANGAEGVEKLKKSIYDIAFMDIDMPVMNGFEATKKLRQWEDVCRPGARQPICALTAAYVDDFERSQLMKFKEAGLDVMESKPCNIPRLFKVVDDVSPMFSDLSISVVQQETSSTASN